MTHYKVAVLIAFYKSQRYVEAKLKCIRAQTIFNDAIFVILNCQNLENEKDIYTPFENAWENVISIDYPEYTKLYPTWNDGIKATSSDYIVNFNADDQWNPQYLERCVRWLDRHDDYAVVSTEILQTTTPNQLWPRWDHITGKLPSHTYPFTTAGPCPVWRRSLHSKYGYFEDYYVISDARMWEKWHAGGEKFGILKEELALYYHDTNSLERRHHESGGLLRDIDLKQ